MTKSNLPQKVQETVIRSIFFIYLKSKRRTDLVNIQLNYLQIFTDWKIICSFKFDFGSTFFNRDCKGKWKWLFKFNASEVLLRWAFIKKNNHLYIYMKELEKTYFSVRATSCFFIIFFFQIVQLIESLLTFRFCNVVSLLGYFDLHLKSPFL